MAEHVSANKAKFRRKTSGLFHRFGAANMWATKSFTRGFALLCDYIAKLPVPLINVETTIELVIVNCSDTENETGVSEWRVRLAYGVI